MTAKGGRSDLFDHLRDVFASGFRNKSGQLSFCEILRKLALANVSLPVRPWSSPHSDGKYVRVWSEECLESARDQPQDLTRAEPEDEIVSHNQEFRICCIAK